MKKSNGVTLIVLIITIIILLILAEVTISQLSKSELLEKAKTSKEITINSQEKENIILNEYENKIDNFAINGTRDENSKYKETILFDGNETNKEIIFLDNHKISEFDSIIFVYGLYTEQGCTTILEKEYRKSTWEYAIQKGNKSVSYVLELNGWGQRSMGIANLSDTGCKISFNTEYHLFRILGINY